jgi:hypothetical protein
MKLYLYKQVVRLLTSYRISPRYFHLQNIHLINRSAENTLGEVIFHISSADRSAEAINKIVNPSDLTVPLNTELRLVVIAEVT